VISLRMSMVVLEFRGELHDLTLTLQGMRVLQ